MGGVAPFFGFLIITPFFLGGGIGVGLGNQLR